MMLNASVIICTHNPRREYLQRVMGGLKNQTLPPSDWELLVIDNASDVPLTPDTWDLSWHPRGRHIREDELGLAPARRRGMREATAEILVFVDDDNIIAADYLARAVRIGAEWPMLGVWGSGITSPEFEVEPSSELVDYLANLALRKNDKAYFSNVMPCYLAMPWGAGQCVRASVARAYCENEASSSIKITGRKGRSLDSSEDLELGYVACDVGMGVGNFPELRVTHLIPKERLNAAYLVKLVEGIGTSTALVEYKWKGIVPTSPFAGLTGIPRVVRTALARKGIRRRMYFAELRSRLRAREIIARRANSAIEGRANP